MKNETEQPSLDDMLRQYLDQKEMRFEGDTGVGNLNTLAEVLGYEQSGFLYGSPFEQLLSDCPGLQEAVIEWISEQNLPEWKDSIESELPPTDEWALVGKTDNYAYWFRSVDNQTVYNCSVNENTPPGEEDGGYHNLKALRRLKNDQASYLQKS